MNYPISDESSDHELPPAPALTPEQQERMDAMLEQNSYSQEVLALGPCPHETSLFSTHPVPVLFVQMHRKQVHHSQVDVYLLMLDMRAVVPRIDLQPTDLCRCIPFRRLQATLRAGIDVAPPTAPFAAASLDKALEYSWWPKVLLMLDRNALAPASKTFPADSDPALLAEVRKDYPTMWRSADGKTVHLSRFPDRGDMGRVMSQERYGYWIPGNPKLALKGVVVLALEGSISAGDVAAALL